MPARHVPTFDMSTPPPKEVYNIHVYLTALIASTGALIFGWDLSFIGTTITLPSFKKDFGLEGVSVSTSNAFAANIVSLLQAGCFIGALAVAPLGDRLGRRPALLIAGIVFTLGSLMQVVSHGSTPVMFVGRAVGGLGVGLASGLVPLYIAELSPPAIRGRLVGVYEISVQAGTCIGFWICYGVKEHMAPTSAQWITPFVVQLILGGLLIIGMLFVPESPRWLVQTQTPEAASRVLSKLRNLPENHPYLLEELSHILDSVHSEVLHSSGGGRLRSQLRETIAPCNRRRFFLGVMVFVFMQWAGSNAINYYSPRIFASIGITGSSTGLFATGIYGVVRLVFIIIAMYFAVDRIGRTKLLMGGSAVMMVSMWFIGAYVKMASPSSSSGLGPGGYAAATFIYIYAVGYCFSYAGIPWIYCSEIFPLRIRGLGMAICTAVHWLLNFVIARSVPYMICNIGYGTYFVFAACITLSIPFVYFCLPETKGLSLEEIEELFEPNGANDGLDAVEKAKHEVQVQYVEKLDS